MSLRLRKRDFAPGRIRKALPVFLLLWTVGLILGGTSVLSGRSHLLSIERIETENLLDAYLAAHRLAGEHFGTFSIQRGRLLPGLVFVRVEQGNNQLLLMGSRSPRSGFDEIAGLPTDREGVWLPVVIGGKQQRLTVVSRKYPEGVRIQVAKDGRRGYGVYRKMVLTASLVILATVPLFLLLSLLFIKLSYAPLVETSKQVARLAGTTGDDLLPEHGNTPELNALCCEINKLLGRNQKLVLTMQQSLDNVAHDLRTPMTRLRSIAEYGLQAEDNNVRLREALADCLEESDRVLGMLRIMMSVAEAESGTMRLELQECNLAKLVEQVCELYEYVAEEHGVSLGAEVVPVTIRVDPTRFSQVIANLVDNGIKYTGSGGRVHLTGSAVEGEIHLAVEDSGMGISPSEQDRIWERLYRGDRSRSQKGLGLGLNYVRAVVRAHGGEVEVSSRLHEGSRFLVRLPRDQLVVTGTQEKSQISGE